MAENPGKSSPAKIGKYEIVTTLGKGAMGVVYRARDPHIGREVALKTMLKELVEGAEEQQRFFREAQSAGNLKHVNIVTIYELGMDGETAFIAMELLEGRDLKQLMRAEPDLPMARKLDIMVKILEGLDYAHRKGVVHRDIKPANIHIGDDGHVKIMDFGIARVSTSEITKTGMVLGTVSYMSPEQVAGEKVDGRSDIFAVGVMLYELVTSKKPFPGETISTIIHKIISKEPEPFPTGGLPPGIEQVIDHALAKNVEERYATAGQMALDLKALLKGDPNLLAFARQTDGTDRTTVAGGPTRATARAATATGPAARTTTAAAAARSTGVAATVHAGDAAPPAPPARSSAPIVIGIVALLLFFMFVAGAAGLLFLGPRLWGGDGGPTASPGPTQVAELTPTSPIVDTPPTDAPGETPVTEPTEQPIPIETPTFAPDEPGDVNGLIGSTPPPIATPEPTPTEMAMATPATPPPVERPTVKPTPEEEDDFHEPTDAERQSAGAIADEGRDLLYANQLKAAEAKLLRAKRLDPSQPNTYLYLILTYRKLGNNAKAQQTMRQAEANVPNWNNNIYVRQLLGN